MKNTIQTALILLTVLIGINSCSKEEDGITLSNPKFSINIIGLSTNPVALSRTFNLEIIGSSSKQTNFTGKFETEYTKSKINGYLSGQTIPFKKGLNTVKVTSTEIGVHEYTLTIKDHLGTEEKKTFKIEFITTDFDAKITVNHNEIFIEEEAKVNVNLDTEVIGETFSMVILSNKGGTFNGKGFNTVFKLNKGDNQFIFKGPTVDLYELAATIKNSRDIEQTINLTITIKNRTPKNLVITTPKNGSIFFQTQEVIFAYSAEDSDKEELEYILHIKKGNDDYKKINLGSNTTYTKSSNSLEKGIYRWKIEAKDPSGDSVISLVNSFEIIQSGGGKFTPLSGESLILDSQDKIEEFGKKGYVEIVGNIFIGSEVGVNNNSVYDLSLLYNLEIVRGLFSIRYNNQLKNLKGLENLKTVNRASIHTNKNLNDVSALKSLTPPIGKITIDDVIGDSYSVFCDNGFVSRDFRINTSVRKNWDDWCVNGTWIK